MTNMMMMINVIIMTITYSAKVIKPVGGDVERQVLADDDALVARGEGEAVVELCSLHRITASQQSDRADVHAVHDVPSAEMTFELFLCVHQRGEG